MSVHEINFDGLIGPTHNYSGLSHGNVAATRNAGAEARPRAAALQGLEKMRRLMALGLDQGFLPPPLRPTTAILQAAGYGGDDDIALAGVAAEDPALFRATVSASSMWTANAATVIAEADSGDGRLHLVVANLATMLHRAVEAEETLATLRRVFPDRERVAVHAPLPLGSHFADEGAANHMRLAASHAEPGVNVFVHGETIEGAPRGAFPERQTERASRAVARLTGMPSERAVFAPQASPAIQAGAFHNDVVAVANASVLLAHPGAFDRRDALFATLRARVAGLSIVEVEGITLDQAVATYLFNSQLVTLPDGDMALIAPAEVREDLGVSRALDRALAGCPQIVAVEIVEVRESMRNGGGPACLRLRVPASAATRATIHPGYLLSPSRWERLTRLVEAHWPASVSPSDLLEPALWAHARAAHEALQAFIDEAR